MTATRAACRSAGPDAVAAQSAAALDYETYTLDNGLRVILAEDRSTPAVAGDFDPGTVKGLVETYFGGAERSEVPPERGCEVDHDAGFRLDTIPDANANLPAVTWTFRTPPHTTPRTTRR